MGDKVRTTSDAAADTPQFVEFSVQKLKRSQAMPQKDRCVAQRAISKSLSWGNYALTQYRLKENSPRDFEFPGRHSAYPKAAQRHFLMRAESDLRSGRDANGHAWADRPLRFGVMEDHDPIEGDTLSKWIDAHPSAIPLLPAMDGLPAPKSIYFCEANGKINPHRLGLLIFFDDRSAIRLTEKK